jgi:hypothetical protein
LICGIHHKRAHVFKFSGLLSLSDFLHRTESQNLALCLGTAEEAIIRCLAYFVPESGTALATNRAIVCDIHIKISEFLSAAQVPSICALLFVFLSVNLRGSTPCWFFSVKRKLLRLFFYNFQAMNVRVFGRPPWHDKSRHAEVIEKR